MAYDGWLEFDGVEIANLSRTAQLGATLGISPVWLSPDESAWIETELGGSGYDNVANAPWYDPGYPASGEFAGFIPLSAAGMGDSTREASVTEFITNGGRSGRARNATLPIVLSGAIVASTERGADYGRRWLDKVLAARGSTTCAGVSLRYFAYAQADAPILHYRDVTLTRGISITRKRTTDCDSVWLFTATLTANDPFEYGELVSQITEIGGATATGPEVASDGSTVLMQESCPVYDYSPIYDPLYPALVPAPTVPDFYPDGWGIVDGAAFDRFWAKINPVEPSATDLVPMITLTSDVDARMVRVSIWPSTSDVDDQCDPLFSVVVTYLPAGTNFIIDGEQQASYVWDGFGTSVRRTDSLVFNPDAQPVEWGSFNDPGQMMVTLDIFADGSGAEGDGTVRASLGFITKSD